MRLLTFVGNNIHPQKRFIFQNKKHLDYPEVNIILKVWSELIDVKIKYLIYRFVEIPFLRNKWKEGYTKKRFIFKELFV